MKISVYDVQFRRGTPLHPTAEAFAQIAMGGRKPPSYRVAIRQGAPVDAAVRVARSMQPTDGSFAGRVYDHVSTVTHVHDVELDPQIAVEEAVVERERSAR